MGDENSGLWRMCQNACNLALKLLADSATSWFKGSFQDSWDAFSKNSRIQLLTIPNARALILEDQPKLADDGVARFIENVSKAKAQRVP